MNSAKGNLHFVSFFTVKNNFFWALNCALQFTRELTSLLQFSYVLWNGCCVQRMKAQVFLSITGKSENPSRNSNKREGENLHPCQLKEAGYSLGHTPGKDQVCCFITCPGKHLPLETQPSEEACQSNFSLSLSCPRSNWEGGESVSATWELHYLRLGPNKNDKSSRQTGSLHLGGLYITKDLG